MAACRGCQALSVALGGGRVSVVVADDAAGLEQAAEALAGGALVALPTDTVYGLVGSARAPSVARRLSEAKGRDSATAVQVLVGGVDQANELAGPDGLGSVARRLADALWPGGLTIVTDRRAGLVLDLGGDPSSIGLRCPAHDVVAAICRRVGPLAATSANGHGEEPLATAAAVAARFDAAVAVVVDGGVGGSAASTVVDVRGGQLRPLRLGVVSWQAVLAAAGAGSSQGADAGSSSGARPASSPTAEV